MRHRNAKISVHRRAVVPDSRRVERCVRLPEFGPRLLFFSGGSALKDASRVLKTHTHNSIHLITPFDSGGSSAILREAFHILGVGDLRNRLMALADETALSEPQVRALFSHRFAADASQDELRAEFEQMLEGVHPLVTALKKPLRTIVLTHLRKFAKKMPVAFDLRVASIGNLILAGGYLVNQREIEAVLYEFSKLVSVRGTVRPTTTVDAHLVAVHEDGTRTVGQHRLGKPESMAHGRIEDLELTTALRDGAPLVIDADEFGVNLIGTADLIAFPMGSFFGSVLANLLPRGIGRAVLHSDCPRIYVPNAGDDPEMHGYSIAGCLKKVCEFVTRDVGIARPPREVLDFVLVDSEGLDYSAALDFDELDATGVQVIDTDLAGAARAEIDPRKLVEVLCSLA
ncbi:MAG: GAK system CofD-like protein [Planctomycetes bacterium]|nr:GAK system CofD-like protein [Planctomycetota bacterium]